MDSDLFLDFRQPEVRSVLAELEEEMEFAIVESAGTLYLVPASGNDLLGFVTKDLREWVASDARLADAFLLCYIIMFLVYLFYGGKNINPNNRNFYGFLSLRGWTGVLDWPTGKEATELWRKYALNFLRIVRGFEERSRKTSGHGSQRLPSFEKRRLIRLVDEDKDGLQKLDDLMLHHTCRKTGSGDCRL